MLELMKAIETQTVGPYDGSLQLKELYEQLIDIGALKKDDPDYISIVSQIKAISQQMAVRVLLCVSVCVSVCGVYVLLFVAGKSPCVLASPSISLYLSDHSEGAPVGHDGLAHRAQD